mgnify:CR=1 FL=1
MEWSHDPSQGAKTPIWRLLSQSSCTAQGRPQGADRGPSQDPRSVGAPQDRQQVPGRPRAVLLEARRGELLAALEELVAEQGYAAMTVPRVVARAGVAQGSFYRYFRNIDDAFSALAGAVMAPIASAAFALDFSGVQSAADVEVELLGYYRVLAAMLSERGALLREVMLRGLALRGPIALPFGVFIETMREHIQVLTRAHETTLQGSPTAPTRG